MGSSATSTITPATFEGGVNLGVQMPPQCFRMQPVEPLENILVVFNILLLLLQGAAITGKTFPGHHLLP